MNTGPEPSRNGFRTAVYLSIATLVAACGGGGGGGSGYANQPPAQPAPPPAAPEPPPPAASAFALSALASDGSIPGSSSDVDVINPWGLVIAPNAPAWFVNNATDRATIYDGTGKKANLVVTIPAGINGAAAPTGIVSNATDQFEVTDGITSASARFIFASEAGTISGWNPSVDPANAITMHDDAAEGAVYKGLAIANNGTADFLYATDFRNNKVDVFDGAFAKVDSSGGFVDPSLPEGFAPYGIQAVQLDGQTMIVVTYAQQDEDARDEVVGEGLGVVNTFDPDGNLIANLIPQGAELNAPWGIAVAPEDFGTLSNALLIGNFGDGSINGFDAATGEFIGALSTADGTPIQNEGLWAIAFGNGARNQPPTTLYFTAGIANQAAGLYGRIDLGETAPDIVAPSVALTTPAEGTVSGAVTVTADASDNVGVVEVLFFAGDAEIGSASEAPFSFEWDTTSVDNGEFELTARASDAFGNVTTSDAVAVTVENVAPPPAPAVTLAELQSAIFSPICSGCHNGNGAGLPGSMNLSSAASTFAALVSTNSVERPELLRVNPGDPDNSYLIDKLEGAQDIVGGQMPLFGTPLDPAVIDQVRQWISDGAPGP